MGKEELKFVVDNGDKSFVYAPLPQYHGFGEKIEPTTKNDLALIHTEGLDEEIRCAMCTNNMKSDRGCDGSCVVNKDMYKAVMDAIEKRIQPTTKNDLGVDCISRKEVLRLLANSIGKTNTYLQTKVLKMPSVTPQEPILDKIRAEIEQFADTHCSGDDINIYDVFQILDKYKAESEGKE